MLQTLTESNKYSSRVMEKIVESITLVGKTIGDGLDLLAAALANSNQSVLTQPLANTTTNLETYREVLLIMSLTLVILSPITSIPLPLFFA